MGLAASKPEPDYDEKRKAARASELRGLANQLAGRIDRMHLDSSTNLQNPISTRSLIRWDDTLMADAKNRLALAAISNANMHDILVQSKPYNEDVTHVFNTKVEIEGNPVTNQRASGRCWLFAATNTFRVGIQKRLDVPKFELSQAYLFFYDKLEKCNFFLENIIETCDLDFDSRLIHTLFVEPVSDGGQWDMVVNLVNKYGLVPQSVYPDSFNAKSSSPLNYVVIEKLREYALHLRELKDKPKETLAALKVSYLEEIHNILTISLGKPPKPNESFVWEYLDSKDKAHRLETTPLAFYKDVTKFDANSYFSLIHDPRHPYNELYTVDRLGNVAGGKPIEYVNASIEKLKHAAISALQNNEPLFFGSDVGKFSDAKSGVMDTEVWDYNVAFNVSLELTKEQRLRTGSSSMTHAMTLTGVHLVDGQPVRWRVENSWGDSVGDKGFFVMSDRWFDEYVFQIVTCPKYTEKALVDVWKRKDYKVLPRWDPLGSLA